MKFNPDNLDEKIIKSDGIQVSYEDFDHAISYMNDKKAHGVDGIPLRLLKRLGRQPAFRLFSQWTNKRMKDTDNELMSTARVVFLSKNKKEIIDNHKDYRCLAVQPLFIRILENIVFNNINYDKI